MKVIWRVSQYLFRYPALFTMVQVLAVGMTLLAIAIPKFIENILTKIQDQGAAGTLVSGIVGIILLYLGSEILNGLRIICNNTLEQKVLFDMRRDLHQKLLILPVSFYDARKSGEISSRVIEDVMAVERALLDGTEMGGRALVMIIGVSIMLFLTNPVLAWFVFLPVPILIVLGIFYSRGSRKVWKHVRESAGDLNSLLVEDIQGNRLIQTFGLQKREGQRFDTKASLLRTRTLKAMFRWAAYNPSTTFMTNLGIVSVIGFGGWMILNGNSEFGFPQLVAFLMYANMLYMPIGQLHGINHMLAAGKASGDRVFEILDAEVEVETPANPEPFPEGALHIRFDQVSFKYPGRPEVLSNFNLELPSGKVTALVGHTGAGKSTVANLTMRTYDVTSGNVTVNGIDIRQLNLEDIHSKVGHVAQDPFLFEGSVRDNLLLACPEASEEDIKAALDGACALEFVLKLPEGLDTNIGEKGIRLSQGEKQRLTIARVLLKNPPFVILDEATASVDTITERLIQQALENLTADRTVLIIAHRLSTVRKADQIVCMREGEIIELGTHDELLSQDGHYARLWSYQNDLIPESASL
ncbi:ABC transporter ATP-binding protein [Puniceicoccales bacterium CK1056]|uniref:ABC transporter ATP-binding protein n=1 Tax=Oceanipulchritudo coccoides TaxID=2706888 RepID=A0A6B2M408_9BACT|nr:ABC transporter ATP-binding protein [Oceanipulchritudo coccoides]NDV62565.1 ABC transporter ATP-binding protein [Oceanipulchritudo coccoides]